MPLCIAPNTPQPSLFLDMPMTSYPQTSIPKTLPKDFLCRQSRPESWKRNTPQKWGRGLRYKLPPFPHSSPTRPWQGEVPVVCSSNWLTHAPCWLLPPPPANSLPRDSNGASWETTWSCPRVCFRKNWTQDSGASETSPDNDQVASLKTLWTLSKWVLCLNTHGPT